MLIRAMLILILAISANLFSDWNELQKVLASDGAYNDNFGMSVSISGDYAVIGAKWNDDNGDNSGSAYIFHRMGTTWSEQAIITASDGAENDNFGYSVSISGDYAVVSATGDDDNGYNSGSAYIFHRTGTTWLEQAKITASDGADHDSFSRSVSIFGDYAVISAIKDDDNGNSSGSAYIFNRMGTTWSEQAKITASDGAELDQFGYSVSISGNYAIIGANWNDDNGYNSGSAYIFHRTGTTWLEQAKITASDGGDQDYFGNSVSITGDYAVIGADGYNSDSAYIFYRTGTTWLEQAIITASDGADHVNFGNSVSVSGDYVTIGAVWDDENGNHSGSAYIFHRTGTTWLEQTKILASDGAAGNHFGNSVSVSGDYVIIGAVWDDDNGSNSGSAYFFEQTYTIIDNSILNDQKEIILYSAYPNPFNPTTTIKYELPINVTNPILEIFNTKGQLINSFILNENQNSLQWNAEDYSSGIYLYHIKSDKQIFATRKMVLLK